MTFLVRPLTASRRVALDRRAWLIVLAVAVLVALALALADPALARPDSPAEQAAANAGAGGRTEAGSQIGRLITGIAGPIVWSLAGLTGLNAFMRRDVGLAFTMMVITILLGLFVTTPGQQALEQFTNVLADALKTVR